MRPFAFFQGARGQRGQSAVEVLIAATVLAVAAQAVTLLIRQASKQAVMNRDKALATEKAIQMMEELRSVVLDNAADVSVLEKSYADNRGPAPSYTPLYKFTLTTNKAVVFANGNTVLDNISGADPLSDNPIRGNGFAFVRHVEVKSNTLDANERQVWVRVYEAAPNSGTATDITTNPPMAKNPGAPPLAEVFGMLHSLGAVNNPNQVMDVYLIALESVPGWWSRTSNLIPLMQASLVSLQARNPGLKVRPHWIQRMSFGRDLEYTPEINSAKSATVTASFKQTYIYPGLVHYDDGDDYFYLPSWFQARVNIDNTMTPNLGYPIADQFNHAMRYPDEENLFNIMSTIAANTGQNPPEMSYRMLLEKMNQNSTDVSNSIVINLHGEMVPVVPLRNYSDAAKDPDYYMVERPAAGKTARAWRAVTHPERLYYKTGNAVHGIPAIDVYAYDANPPADPITAADQNDLIDNITLFIPGATLDNLQQVESVQGNSIVAYYRNIDNAGTWFDVGSPPNRQIYDGPLALTTSSTFIADEYAPPGRGVGTGLRIRLFGTTPTARAFTGQPH